VCLDLTVTSLLHAHNDVESSVRILSGECLNLVIRTHSDKNMYWIQVALFKGIKVNER